MSIVGLVLAVVILTGALFIRFGVISAPGTGGLPADVLALGQSIKPLDPVGYMSQDDAQAIAKADIGSQFQGARVDAYLIHIQDKDTAGLQDRDVWLIKVAGIDISVPGPPPRPDATPMDRRATTAYVFVDAVTGELITTALYP